MGMTSGVKNTNIKRNVAWNTVGNVIYCICQWAITILVVRLASYEQAGYLSLAMTTSSSFSAIALYKMRDFQVSDVRGEFTSNEYVASRIISMLTALVLCVIYALFGNSLYQVLCIFAFMLVRIAEAFVDVLHGVDQKFDRYDYIGKSYILRGIATIISFILMLKIWGNLFGALLVMAVINLIIAYFYDWMKTSRLENLRPEYSKRLIKLFGKCLPIVIFSFLTAFINLLPKEIISELLGEEQLGIYSSIASPTLIVQVFASVVFAPFLPIISVLIESGKAEELRKRLLKVCIALGVLCIVVPIGAMLLGRIGLKLLFGSDILLNYDLFMPIVWCTTCLAIVWILSSIVVAFRKIMELLAGMIMSFVICVLDTRPLIEKYGMNGASYAQIISYVVMILFMVLICAVSLIKMSRENN